MIRLRRTVADRKRLLTKVIEGLGQHGMVRNDDNYDDYHYYGAYEVEDYDDFEDYDDLDNC